MVTRFMDSSPALILRTMRYLPRNHCSSQTSLGPVVGRFNLRVFEEQEHPPPVVLPPDPIEQSLVVGVARIPVPQLPCEFLSNGFSPGPVFFHRTSLGTVFLPESQRLPQCRLHVPRKAFGPSYPGLLHHIEIFEEMAQTLLLGDLRERSIVDDAPAACVRAL